MSSMDTTIDFAYDYVAIGNIYLNIKISSNEIWGQ